MFCSTFTIGLRKLISNNYCKLSKWYIEFVLWSGKKQTDKITKFQLNCLFQALYKFSLCVYVRVCVCVCVCVCEYGAKIIKFYQNC